MRESERQEQLGTRFWILIAVLIAIGLVGVVVFGLFGWMFFFD